jgi:hypothetical protein
VTDVLIVRKTHSAEYLVEDVFALVLGQGGSVWGQWVASGQQVLHQVSALHQFEHQHHVVRGFRVLNLTKSGSTNKNCNVF